MQQLNQWRKQTLTSFRTNQIVENLLDVFLDLLSQWSRSDTLLQVFRIFKSYLLFFSNVFCKYVVKIRKVDSKTIENLLDERHLCFKLICLQQVIKKKHRQSLCYLSLIKNSLRHMHFHPLKSFVQFLELIFFNEGSVLMKKFPKCVFSGALVYLQEHNTQSKELCVIEFSKNGFDS